jgi:hypothetical protein
MAEKEGEFDNFKVIRTSKGRSLVLVGGKLFNVDKVHTLADTSRTAYCRCVDRHCHGRLRMKVSEDEELSDPQVRSFFILNDCL